MAQAYRHRPSLLTVTCNYVPQAAPRGRATELAALASYALPLFNELFFLLYLGLNRKFPQLRHHTIFMPQQYCQHVQQIFDGQGMPEDLALYLHTPTCTDTRLAPPGGESLYVLVPMPNLAHGIDWQRAAPILREKILHYLEAAGLTGLRESIISEHWFTPLDFASQLRSHLGAAFSIEPTLLQSAYFRPHNRCATIGGLYFVGAGTHPGAGIPGVLLSAELTSRLVIEDLSRHPLPSVSQTIDVQGTSHHLAG